MIYYGDECGMWGSNDPDCRKPMVWNDKKYEPETNNPDQTKHNRDKVVFNKDLFNWYKKFIYLRNQYQAIKAGNYTTLLTYDAQKVYAFSRKLGNEEVIVVINRGNEAVHFTLPIFIDGNYKDVFTKKTMRQLDIEPMGIVVLSNTLL